MKRLITILILMLIVVLPAAAQTDAPLLGVYDVLESDATIDGEFTDTSGMNIYAFAGAEGDTVTLRMVSANDAVDPYLMLLGSDGSLIGWDDDSGGDLNAELTAELPADGLYFVLVSTFRGMFLPESAAGDYTLTLSGTSAAVADWETVLAAPPVAEVDLEETYTVTLSEEAPFFIAYLNVQDSVTVGLGALSQETDTLMYVFGEDGARIAIDDDSGQIGYSAFIPAVSLDESGKYLILVTQRDVLETTTFGDFQFSVARP